MGQRDALADGGGPAAEVSEGLDDISGDGIRLLNSFHPSDERTAAAFSGTGGAFLLEGRAQATQI